MESENTFVLSMSKALERLLASAHNAVLTSVPGKIDSAAARRMRGDFTEILVDLRRSLQHAPRGTLFQHYKGDIYRALGAGFIEKDKTPVIYYQLASDVSAPVWVRPVSEFNEVLIVNGVEVPRFMFYTEPVQPV